MGPGLDLLLLGLEGIRCSTGFISLQETGAVLPREVYVVCWDV